MSQMELREFRAEQISTNDEGRLEGLVAPFSRETVIGDLSRGGFREEIAPGAFNKTLKDGDVILLDNHDMTRPLARKSAGTLELRESGAGLEFSAIPADTSYGRDLRANIKARNIGGMSFGFEPIKDDWFDDEGAPSNRHVGTRRVLREVKLIEVSAVTRPAYSGTVVSARAVDDAREERGPKPYGNVKYADPKNGKYPVDTEEHARAAWSYINMPKNASKYPLNGVSLSSVKSAIKSALRHFGIKVSKNRAIEDVDLTGYCPEHGFEPRCEGVANRALGKSSKKRVLQIHAELKQALDLCSQLDLDKLPQEAQDAFALVSSAEVHAGHITHKEKLNADDLVGSRQKPGSPTSAEEAHEDEALLADLLRSQAAAFDCV